jgi:hypothetical protein
MFPTLKLEISSRRRNSRTLDWAQIQLAPTRLVPVSSIRVLGWLLNFCRWWTISQVTKWPRSFTPGRFFDGQPQRRGVRYPCPKYNTFGIQRRHNGDFNFRQIFSFNTIRISSLDHATLIIHREKLIPKLARFQLDSTTNISICTPLGNW